jgi:transposase
MLSLSSTARIYLCCQPIDMRKSFDGLAAAAASLLGQAPTSGHYFVFVSRRRKLLKILCWEGDGYAIWSKRLEQGQFNLPKNIDGKPVIDIRDLHMLIDGIKPAGFFKRYDKNKDRNIEKNGKKRVVSAG